MNDVKTRGEGTRVTAFASVDDALHENRLQNSPGPEVRGMVPAMPPPLVLRSVTWDWSRPYLLGIVNVTPDSFSDGGLHASTHAAIAQGERLVAEGADAIDVGGESTRPGAEPVSAEEEIARVVPVIRALARDGIVVSVDTTKASVARAAFDAGAEILNDVSMGDPVEKLVAVVSAFRGAYLRMHSRGTPATMTQQTDYRDVVADVSNALRTDAETAQRAGLDAARIVVDPGIGFAKTADQSLTLLANIAELRSLGYAVCVGPSRKSFIDGAAAYAPAWNVTPVAASERIGGTAAAVALAVAAGAEVVRVHDVRVMRQAARVAHAVRLRREGRRG